MTNPMIIDIYCRSATGGPEARTHLEQQATSCRTYCEVLELAIGQVHFEVASGSRYHDREQLSLLRRRYHNGSIQGVVVTTLDRLSRSPVHLAILLGEMEATGVTLHSVREPLEESTTGRQVRFILDFMSKVEREKAPDRLLIAPDR